MSSLTGRILVVGDHGIPAPDAYPPARRIRRGFTGHTVFHRGATAVEQAFARAWRTDRGAVEPCEDPLAAIGGALRGGVGFDLLIAFIALTDGPASAARRCAAAGFVAGIPLITIPAVDHADLDTPAARVLLGAR